MNLKAFIIGSQYKTAGIGRFLESLQIPFLDQKEHSFEVVYCDKIEDSNKHPCDIAIFGNCFPQDLTSSTAAEKKFYTFCSPFGQADMSSQDFYSSETVILINAIALLQAGKIDGVITSSKALASRFGFMYVPMTRLMHNSQVRFTFDRYGYSLLGNNRRKHRNVVNQLAAISLLRPKMPIIASYAQNYEHYAKVFECDIQSQEGLEDDTDYLSAIAQHKLTFQCNFSESFSYLAYEYGIQGVPCICSHSIDWYPLKECIVDNPDNWHEIYTKAQLLISDASLYRDCSYRIAEYTRLMATRNTAWLKEVVYENFVKLS